VALFLNSATLVDGTGADPRQKTNLVIDQTIIASITAQSSAVRDDDHAFDLSGCTLLPGLIDAHAHVGLVVNMAADSGAMSAAEIAAKTFRNCELALDAGFTTLRDMGGVDGGLARAIESGDVRGPRIYPSGPAIAQTGGHGHLAGPFCDLNHPLSIPGLVQLLELCDSPDEVRRAARKIFRRGATQLKLFISGGVVSHTDRLEDTQLTVDEMRAAVVEARARKTYVAGHAHNCDAIRNGLAAGLECFEHATMLDEATAAAIKTANAAVDPTMTVCNLMVSEWKAWGLDESVVARMSGVEAKMIDAVRIARDAGLLIGSGSDLLGPDQNRRGLEIVLKSRILGPMDALVSATLNNAKIMRVNDKLGTLEPGKIADVIAVRGDPLAQPEIFDDPSRVVLVIKAGRVVKNLLAA
jgi:imidazolonepropionase-like amidohydrolase